MKFKESDIFSGLCFWYELSFTKGIEKWNISGDPNN